MRDGGNSDESFYQATRTLGGLQVPPSYRRLREAARLDVPVGDWLRHARRWALTAPIPLMHHPEAPEWLGLSEIFDEAVRGRMVNARRFVPFAQNGYGDRWGWSFGARNAADPAVMFAPSTSAEAMLVAPHFEGFLFRSALEQLSCAYVDEHLEIGHAEMTASLRLDTALLSRMIRPRWASWLVEIAERVHVQHVTRDGAGTVRYYGFCHWQEVRSILARAFARPEPATLRPVEFRPIESVAIPVCGCQGAAGRELCKPLRHTGK